MDTRTYLRAASQLAIWIVMFFAGLVLLGWCLDVVVLKSLPPIDIQVQAKTAFSFFLCGMAALLLCLRNPHPGLTYLAKACAAIVFVMALATLVQYLWGIRSGLDQLLLSDMREVGSNTPGVAPIAALTFLFVSGSLLTIDLKFGENFCPYQYLLIAAAVLSQLTLIGYAFGVPMLYAIDRFTYLASPNSVVFLLICIGVLLSRVDYGVTKVLAGEGLGGAMARRVTSLCIVLPVILGSVRQTNSEIGTSETDVILIFLLVLTICAFPALLFWYCVKLDEMDTARKSYEKQLEQTVDKLARTNAELEQFASVASHDLKEPLRTISTSLQLLQRRNRDKLGPDSENLMRYAVDGAQRMHALVNDLLVYARASAEDRELVACDCKKALDTSLENLKVAIDDSGATITFDELPVVKADPTQLIGLFQNLIGNAIKFRSSEKPVVHISAKLNAREWLFSVADNGIGIDMTYAERIFVIFKQLHGKKYSGTGIGLAVCKKIVENFGGRIWVESELGKGATFFFTLPTL